MKLAKPEAFLTRFYEYCYVPSKKDTSSSERARLCRRFAWYEAYLANMIVDFVERGRAGDSLPGEQSGWVCMREQEAVDVVLIPPEFQKRDAPLFDDNNPHSPLYEMSNEDWAEGVISIETKIIANAHWTEPWKSAIADLKGRKARKRKGGRTWKPRCDYLLALVFSFEPERQQMPEWVCEKGHGYPAFEALKPGDTLEIEVTEGQPMRIDADYIARWPESGASELPKVKWDEREWRAHTASFFAILLAPKP